MTQEDKELLLKDLCARLPHGVKYQTYLGDIFTLKDIVLSRTGTRYYIDDNAFDLSQIKPYLRPMSSMTEDEKNELKEYLDAEEVDCNGFGYSEGGTLEDYISSIPYTICFGVVDWLNKNKFDYRGLIKKGLALEAPEDMYKQKTKQ